MLVLESIMNTNDAGCRFFSLSKTVGRRAAIRHSKSASRRSDRANQRQRPLVPLSRFA